MIGHYIKAVAALAASHLKRTFRDKTALFFTFLFPLMFLLVFGSLNRGGDGISFDVAVINHSSSDFSQQFLKGAEEGGVLKIDNSVTSLDQGKEMMSKGDIDSILEIPENFGAASEAGLPSGTLVVYYEEANPQGGQTLAAVVQGIFDKMNQDLTGTTPPFKVESRSTATNSLSSFDYIFAGLLSFSILSLGIFGLANTFPAEKKAGTFRRLRAAPITAAQIIGATAINYLVTGLMSVALMVIAALLVFDFNMRGDYFSMALFAVLGILMMFGFGLAIGGWAKSDAQAAPLANIVAFPMMFLSGVFFPRFLMPDWLQNITRYVPLSPVVDGLRAITAEGKSILQLGPELAIIAVWTLIAYGVAIWLFRWE